jgi:hypothetical protein
MKSRTRFVLISSLASFLLTLPIKPASASLTDTTFTDLFSIFQQAFEDARAYLEDLLSGTLAHFPGDLDGIIMNAVGNLGLVDPNQVRSDIAEELVSTLVGDLAHSDGIYAGVEMANEVDRQLTRTQINTVLGQEGQDTFSTKITWLEDTLAQVQQQADSAQVAISTQDAIKHMAQQNAMETQVLGVLQSELLQARQDSQLTNLNLSNISQSLDQQTRARRLQEMGSAMETLQITSQARLF